MGALIGSLWAVGYKSDQLEKFAREFQTKAHDKLRQGVIDGNRCQMLMAPTGAGKTFLGLRVAHEALRKGFSATFLQAQ